MNADERRQNVEVEWVTLLLLILKDQCSDLEPGTGSPGFTYSLQSNVVIECYLGHYLFFPNLFK
jgi:hypothetical protein